MPQVQYGLQSGAGGASAAFGVSLGVKPASPTPLTPRAGGDAFAASLQQAAQAKAQAKAELKAKAKSDALADERDQVARGQEQQTPDKPSKSETTQKSGAADSPRAVGKPTKKAATPGKKVKSTSEDGDPDEAAGLVAPEAGDTQTAQSASDGAETGGSDGETTDSDVDPKATDATKTATEVDPAILAALAASKQQPSAEPTTPDAEITLEGGAGGKGVSEISTVGIDPGKQGGGLKLVAKATGRPQLLGAADQAQDATPADADAAKQSSAANDSSGAIELPAVATADAVDADAADTAVKLARPAAATNSADRLAAFMGLREPGTKAAEPLVTAKPVTPAQTLAQTPDGAFASVNTPSIVSAVSGKMLDNGGTITLRLDPPEMGALQVAVVMKNGLASVTFSADNAEAAKALTQSMSQLRDSLSAAGVSLEKFSVQHVTTPNSSNSGSNSDSGSNKQSSSGRGTLNDGGGAGAFRQQDDAARREQQRRELLERMWRQTAGTDVSLVA